MKTLSTEKVCKTYNKRKVVNEVTVEVNTNEIVGLLGPNGAGKTTTFYMVVGLIKPDRGRVILNGEDITKMPMYLRAKKNIGYLAQEPSVFRKLTVEDNIMAILENIEYYIVEKKDEKGNIYHEEVFYNKKSRIEKMNQVIEELKIEKVRKSMGYALSGGERRRVEIARILATDPQFMLLDEPFAGVDPIAVEDIKNIVNHLRKEKKIGILISDHNVLETLDITDRAYVMAEGNLIAEGDPHKLSQNELVRKLYLGENFSLKKQIK